MHCLISSWHIMVKILLFPKSANQFVLYIQINVYAEVVKFNGSCSKIWSINISWKNSITCNVNASQILPWEKSVDDNAEQMHKFQSDLPSKWGSAQTCKQDFELFVQTVWQEQTFMPSTIAKAKNDWSCRWL